MVIIKSTADSLAQRLGADVRFPLAGNFESVEGLNTLLQDIQTLLLTIPGERVGRPEFGCNLRNQVWENIDVGANAGAASISSALSEFESRITVTDVTFTINRNTDLITYSIKFLIDNTDVSTNLIFPFRSSQEISAF